MDRRKFLALGAVAAAGSCLNFKESMEETGRPLKSYGEACQIRIGCQAWKQQLQDPAFANLVATNFNLLTAGNEVKWSRIHPQPDEFNFRDGDIMLKFAEQNEMLFHGHNLCWNASNPPWLDKTLSEQNARQYLIDHITTVVKHYAGRVESWDVVNEPIDYRGQRPDLLRTGIWLSLLGPEYIDIAFEATAAADPQALRVLNVFEVELDFSMSEKTRAATLTLVKQLLQRGVPLQAIGLESHLNGKNVIASASRDRFLRELRDLGLQILITEFDVDDTNLPDAVSDRDRAVSKVYQDYLTDVVPVAETKRIIFWTPHDKGNWYDADPQRARPDRQPHRSGLWDEALRPKVAVAGVEAALQSVCS